MSNKLKVMTIVGTRPEIIRLSRVISELNLTTNHVLVHTGQNWDFELNDVFFQDLRIEMPDYILNAGGGSLGETLGKILSESERVILKEKPDAVLVLGDTNSAISAIMARRLKIPVYHMEAGNRSFDRNVPEETNRKIIDHIADFNLVYTEHARRHLLSEGISHRRIYLTGSPMREVLEYYKSDILKSKIIEKLGIQEKKYIIASLHREENVDNSTRLNELMISLNALAETYDMPVIVSTHPRTQKRIDALGDFVFDSRVRYMKPLGFHDYNRLQLGCFCAISDSGTIGEESAILDFAAVTPRDAIERPEALDAGSLMLTQVDRRSIVDAVYFKTQTFQKRSEKLLTSSIPIEYMIDNTSKRVANLIIGTARISNIWDGIRANDLSNHD